MDAIYDEEQLALFDGGGEGHELVKISHLGDCWRAYCSCGWLSRITPDRWRCKRHHATHRKHTMKDWADWT